MHINKLKVAIIGATGAVGREMVSDLEEFCERTSIPLELCLFASPRSAGEAIAFLGRRIVVQAWSLEAVKDQNVVLVSAGGEFSRKFAKKIADQGCVVIDNSSAWRMDPEVPLIVPEINAILVRGFSKGIIANPNCSTIQLVVPLDGLDRAFGLDMVEVSTYQSVSGSGQQGIAELSTQVKDQFNMQDPIAKLYPQPISFNVLSSIGPVDDDGHCEEEVKMVRETRKILGKSNLSVFATTARVPVLSCHCESVLVKVKKEVSLEQLEELFIDLPGVEYYSERQSGVVDSPTPANIAGRSEVFVSRLRLPLGLKKSSRFQFWIVADNLKKGAATNAVQILGEWCSLNTELLS